MNSITANRIASIDVFRAFTMFLMIFVNDLWTLSGIPKWLEHTAATTDGMGLADIVFPAFLVVMGMSIPFAIQNRIAKGQNKFQILKHIVTRSFALIVMGVFTVNTPLLDYQATGMNGSWYEILAVICFFLIWNVYPKIEGSRRYFYLALQIVGAAGLVVLALIYRGQGDVEGEIVHMQPRWWGILGLIGWAYLGSAVLYLYFQNSISGLILCWLVFAVFNIAGHTGLFGEGEVFVGNGAFHAFTFAGILCTVLFQQLKAKTEPARLLSYVVIAALVLILAGFGLRNFFIISKILATPPWIMICSGISLLIFVGIYYLVDLQNKESWFSIIKAGGTSTLTCYLIPYLYYDIAQIYNLNLPAWAHYGWIGIIKSILFALLIIGITAFLGKLKIKLKI